MFQNYDSYETPHLKAFIASYFKKAGRACVNNTLV